MNGRCPKDSALIALFMNEATAREGDKLLRHLAACARCALRFNVLRQVKRDLGPQVDSFATAFGAEEGASLLRAAAGQKIRALDPRSPGTISLPRSRPTGMLLGLRFAVGFIAVLAVVTSGAYLMLARLQKHSELRSPSLSLTLLAPVGTIAAAPNSFRWTPVLNAEGYFLELVDDSLGLVHTGSTFLITESALPAKVRSRLVKGRTYVWTVSALDADGTLVTSRSGSFIIE